MITLVSAPPSFSFPGHSYFLCEPSYSLLQILDSFAPPDTRSYYLSKSSCFLQSPQMGAQPLSPPTSFRLSYPFCYLLSQLLFPWIKLLFRYFQFISPQI